MAVHDMRATQKIIEMNPNKDKGLEKIELRVKTIEQSVNLILKKSLEFLIMWFILKIVFGLKNQVYIVRKY